MKGIDIVNRARLILNDADGIRWTNAEYATWINDGCRFIALLRPDSCVVNGPMNLVAGTKQSIAALNPSGLRLLDVVRAVNTGRAIRLTDRETLDTQIPNWHAATAAVPTNYVFDNRDPKTFYVYPPAIANTPVEIIYSRNPVEVTEASMSTVDLSVDDIFMDPLLNYVLHRAYSKDADFAQNAELAAGYRNLVQTLLGGKTRTDNAYQPEMNAPTGRPQAGARAGVV
jgi:hypothetical protein